MSEKFRATNEPKDNPSELEDRHRHQAGDEAREDYHYRGIKRTDEEVNKSAELSREAERVEIEEKKKKLGKQSHKE